MACSQRTQSCRSGGGEGDVSRPLLLPDPNSGFTVPCPTATQERTAFLPVAVSLALPP